MRACYDAKMSERGVSRKGVALHTVVKSIKRANQGNEH